MNKKTIIWSVLFLLSGTLIAQTDNKEIQDSLTFKGQISLFENINPNNTLELWTGLRYIPQLNYEINFPERKKIDFEASANVFGSLGLSPFDSTNTDGDISPYRLWARYSTPQFELRAGLQKINFGSSSILRPLMWFDQRDPRDPLQLTNGVWGVLSRYYFLNNANVWLWALYGNDNVKGWEVMHSHKSIPEFGGRFQTPVPRGEAAITYHYRTADSRDFYDPGLQFEKIPEHRIGFDAKFDMEIGWWVEASWIHKTTDVGYLNNQNIINLGMDYTFGVGNGLTVIFEQLFAGYGTDPFDYDQQVTFSLVNVTYPIGLFDNISAIVYFDWTNKNAYNFISWQKQFNHFSMFLMGYINPKQYNIPTQQITGENLFAGSGLQVMLVYNH